MSLAFIYHPLEKLIRLLFYGKSNHTETRTFVANESQPGCRSAALHAAVSEVPRSLLNEQQASMSTNTYHSLPGVIAYLHSSNTLNTEFMAAQSLLLLHYRKHNWLQETFRFLTPEKVQRATKYKNMTTHPITGTTACTNHGAIIKQTIANFLNACRCV